MITNQDETIRAIEALTQRLLATYEIPDEVEMDDAIQQIAMLYLETGDETLTEKRWASWLANIELLAWKEPTYGFHAYNRLVYLSYQKEFQAQMEREFQNSLSQFFATLNFRDGISIDGLWELYRMAQSTRTIEHDHRVQAFSEKHHVSEPVVYSLECRMCYALVAHVNTLQNHQISENLGQYVNLEQYTRTFSDVLRE